MAIKLVSGLSIRRRQKKQHWSYINRDRETAHDRLEKDGLRGTLILGVMLDTVASYDLACIFLIGESNNDVNVLIESSLFTDMLKEEAPNVNFTMNRHEYNQWYYLADGISP